MKQPTWWVYSVDDVVRLLHTNVQTGLSSQEVRRRLKEYGKNDLPGTVRKSWVQLIAQQFSSFFIWMLAGAAIISFLLGQPADAAIIAAILALNVAITFFQEYRAEASIVKLLDMTRPLATVIRDGAKMQIPSSKVVPGDILFIETGDVVVADGRLIEALRVTVDESPLTGESSPRIKTIDALSDPNLVVADRTNMLFRGTAVLTGRGRMVVTATGATTELGAISHVLQRVDRRKTFFEVRLNQLVRSITWICMGAIGIILCFGFVQGITLYELFFIGLSLMVAAVPEALPLATTLALAYSTKRMAQNHILMRRLSAVETLGRVSVICSDKTGTLTKNEKVVTTVWTDHVYTTVTGSGYAPEGTFERDGVVVDPLQDPVLNLALKTSVLSNAAEIYRNHGVWTFRGDPSEAAMMAFGQKAGFTPAALDKEQPSLLEIPFDATLRLTGCVRTDGKQATLYVKGAYDTILPHATQYVTAAGLQPLTSEKIHEIVTVAKQMASQGLRLFALAYRPNVGTVHEKLKLDEELTFIGLCGMTDPLRPGVHEAIETCKKAGIKTVMITGDHPDTAFAIGNNLGLVDKDSRIITGAELDGIDDASLQEIIPTIAICARSSVEHKVRMVQAWQARGAVVATTGDGVNDAPALKVADVGVAMGLAGTPLAKEASDMILLDDNFASVVRGIQEGRGIFDGVRKFAGYLIVSTVAELSIVSYGIIWGMTDHGGNHMFLLLPIHLLWLDIGTEFMMTTALVSDQPTDAVMLRKPNDFLQPLLPWRAVLLPAYVGSVIVLGIVSGLYWHFKRAVATSLCIHTFTFTAMVVLELVGICVMRVYYGASMRTSKRVLLACCGILMAQAVLIYVPSLAAAFHVAPMAWCGWLSMLLLAGAVFIGGCLPYVVRKMRASH